MTLDITTFEPMLKEYYAGPTPELLAYSDHPLLSMMPKSQDWGGQENKYIVPLWIDSTQAIGASFTKALAAKGRGLYDRFEVGRRNRYGFVQLDRLTMKASMKNPKSFLKAYTAEVDGAFNQFGNDAAWNVYRSESGKRGTVGAVTTAANSSVTLSNRADVVAFSVGMQVVATDAPDAPGATAVDTLTERTIDRIDRSNGILYFDGENLGAAGWAAGDHIHRDADIVTAGTLICIQGLGDWLPATAPGSSDDFNGVNRSVDTDRLAGHRVDGTALTINEALIDAGMRMRESSRKPTHIFMNPVDYGTLVKELDGRVHHDKVKSPGKASVSFDAIKVYTPAGTLPVIADPDCPAGTIFMLKLSCWKLASVGPYPEIFDEDTRMLRAADSDSYEVRFGGYGNLTCNDPSSNCRITLY